MSSNSTNYVVSAVVAAVVSVAAHFGFEYQGKLTGQASVSTEAEVKSVVQRVIDQEPKLIVDSVDKYFMAMKNKGSGDAKMEVVHYKDDGKSPTAGNPQGDVTIVDFFDYSCGYCQKMVADKLRVISEDKQIKYVFKDFPILGQPSVEAAKAATAVFFIAPEKYFDFHKGLMESNAPRSQELFDSIAKDIGIEPAKLQERMKQPDVAELINKNLELGRSLGIRGTPAFIINGKLVPGAIGYDSMKDLVKEVRAKK